MSFNISKYHFKSNKIFHAVMPIFLDELKHISQLVVFKKNEILYTEGSKAKAVYLVKTGKVKIEQTTANGDSRIVYVYTAGECFGFRPQLCNEKNPVTATALEESCIEVYDGKGFVDIARKSPNLSFNLLEILSFEFSVWINLITSLSHKSAKERIALILLILNEKYQTNDGQSFITMSKQDIANYAETTEETVVRVLKFYQEKRIINNYGRKFEIINTKMLEIIAEGF